MEGWKSGFRIFYPSDFISNTQIFAFVLTKCPIYTVFFLTFWNIRYTLIEVALDWATLYYKTYAILTTASFFCGYFSENTAFLGHRLTVYATKEKHA